MYMADGLWVDGFIRAVGTCGILHRYSCLFSFVGRHNSTRVDGVTREENAEIFSR